ncbi:MAG: reverse transcriptase domain-containing protein, partial [Sedimenticola sp.]
MFRITIESTVAIPPGAEMIVGAQVQARPEELAYMKEAIVESIPSGTLAMNGVLVARSLVDARHGCVPLRLINLTSKTQTLYKETLAATTETVDTIHPIKDDDNTTTFSQNVRNIGETLDEIPQSMPDYLRNVWENNTEHLNEDQKLKFARLLIRHKDVFAGSKYDLGRTDLLHHKIDTGSQPPIKQRTRRLPMEKMKIAKQEVESMLDNGIIEPSISPWASPIVLVDKKDGTTRFCVDYRALNQCTRKDSYPLPRAQDCFDAMGGTNWFSSIDLQSGYWQVAMDPSDADKTAFTCPLGLYQFRVLPFGLCNGPPTFERLMEHVLSGLQWTICLLYIDDVVTFSKTFDEHIDRLSQVLTRISNAGLKVSPKKCHFFQKEIHFLGHVVSETGISTDPEKTAAVQNWPQPKTVKQVRSFLGFCSYYRRYVKGFAQIAQPLHKLIQKGETFKWTEQCATAFTQLKQTLTSPPILAFPIIDQQGYILDTDASSYAIGSVLSQVQDSHERVIAYYSQTLNKPERNYCITRRELLAIVQSVKHFHHYLYGSRCLIRTDHGALTWLFKFKNPEGQLARWLQVLSTYNITIEYRPGRLNGNADGLSRLPCFPCSHCEKREIQERERVEQNIKCECEIRKIQSSQDTDMEDDSIEDTLVSSQWISSKSFPEIRACQETDKVLEAIIDWKGEKKRKPEWAEISHLGAECKHYLLQWDRLTIVNEVLYRKWYDSKSDDTRMQLVVPKVWRDEIIRMLHNNVCAGHLGMTKTVARVRSRFYWVGYKADVLKACNDCVTCQARKMPAGPSKAPMQSYHVG